jgi:hypothetical protein
MFEIFLFHGDFKHRYIEGEMPSDLIDFLIAEELDSYTSIIMPNISLDMIEVLSS